MAKLFAVSRNGPGVTQTAFTSARISHMKGKVADEWMTGITGLV